MNTRAEREQLVRTAIDALEIGCINRYTADRAAERHIHFSSAIYLAVGLAFASATVRHLIVPFESPSQVVTLLLPLAMVLLVLCFVAFNVLFTHRPIKHLASTVQRFVARSPYLVNSRVDLSQQSFAGVRDEELERLTKQCTQYKDTVVADFSRQHQINRDLSWISAWLLAASLVAFMVLVSKSGWALVTYFLIPTVLAFALHEVASSKISYWFILLALSVWLFFLWWIDQGVFNLSASKTAPNVIPQFLDSTGFFTLYCVICGSWFVAFAFPLLLAARDAWMSQCTSAMRPPTSKKPRNSVAITIGRRWKNFCALSFSDDSGKSIDWATTTRRIRSAAVPILLLACISITWFRETTALYDTNKKSFELLIDTTAKESANQLSVDLRDAWSSQRDLRLDDRRPNSFALLIDQHFNGNLGFWKDTLSRTLDEVAKLPPGLRKRIDELWRSGRYPLRSPGITVVEAGGPVGFAITYSEKSSEISKTTIWQQDIGAVDSACLKAQQTLQTDLLPLAGRANELGLTSLHDRIREASNLPNILAQGLERAQHPLVNYVQGTESSNGSLKNDLQRMAWDDHLQGLLDVWQADLNRGTGDVWRTALMHASVKADAADVETAGLLPQVLTQYSTKRKAFVDALQKRQAELRKSNRSVADQIGMYLALPLGLTEEAKNDVNEADGALDANSLYEIIIATLQRENGNGSSLVAKSPSTMPATSPSTDTTRARQSATSQPRNELLEDYVTARKMLVDLRELLNQTDRGRVVQFVPLRETRNEAVRQIDNALGLPLAVEVKELVFADSEEGLASKAWDALNDKAWEMLDLRVWQAFPASLTTWEKTGDNTTLRARIEQDWKGLKPNPITRVHSEGTKILANLLKAGHQRHVECLDSIMAAVDERIQAAAKAVGDQKDFKAGTYGAQWSTDKRDSFFNRVDSDAGNALKAALNTQATVNTTPNATDKSKSDAAVAAENAYKAHLEKFKAALVSLKDLLDKGGTEDAKNTQSDKCSAGFMLLWAGPNGGNGWALPNPFGSAPMDQTVLQQADDAANRPESFADALKRAGAEGDVKEQLQIAQELIRRLGVDGVDWGRYGNLRDLALQGQPTQGRASEKRE